MTGIDQQPQMTGIDQQPQMTGIVRKTLWSNMVQLQSAPHLARARAPPHLARARAPPHLARAPPHLAGAHHLHLQSAPHLARARAPSWTMAGSRQDRRHQVQLQSSGPRQGSGRTWPGPGPHHPRAVEHLEWSWMGLAVSRQWPLGDAVLSAFSVIVPG